MGFFSSRKAEDNDSYVTTTVAGSGHDKSVVQVIRSRFYGKQKGKEREDHPTFKPHGASAAQTLSDPTPSTYAPSASSPLSRSDSSKRVAGPSILRNTNDRPLPSTPSKKKSSDMPPPPSPTSTRIREGSTSAHGKISSINSSANLSPRKATDTVTVTLAQRLNELAVANLEGLLNDDEYRLLRQNLFERFSSTAIVPIETPLVPAARPRPKKSGPIPESRPASSRPLSNFQVEVPRPSSIRSHSSVASGMSDLFRRATGRRIGSGSNDFSETSSIWSGTSNTSNFFKFPRVLSKKSSNSSVRTAASRTQADTISITSRRTGAGSERSPSDSLSHFSPSGSRSVTGSIRRAAPPSSFRGQTATQENKYANSVNNVFDEEKLKSTQEIRQEILAVEAEARRLMDAFNGLELTTLTRSQRHIGRPSPKTADSRSSNLESPWSAIDSRSQRRVNIVDNDAISIRSGASVGTTLSMPRSAYSTRKSVRQKSSLNASLTLGPSSRPGSLHRKNSASSISSDKKPGKNIAVPPVPALPSAYGHLGVSVNNNSAVSLARSGTGHLPMSSVPEDDSAIVSVTSHGMGETEEEYENEMEDIQRRREEVRLRYEARLDYLRAKLKGAQLHEKLLKK